MVLKKGNLFHRQRSIRYRNFYMIKVRRELGKKGVIVGIGRVWILRDMVCLNLRIIKVSPVNAIGFDILSFIPKIKTPYTLFQHPEKKHIARTGVSRSTLSYNMVIPCLSPIDCILIDDVEEEKVK